MALFAIIYCADTAVGRVMLGWQRSALSTRYVTLMIPAGMAIYLHLAAFGTRPVLGGSTGGPSGIHPTALALIYTLAISYGAVHMDKPSEQLLLMRQCGEMVWVRTYLATHDSVAASVASSPYLITPYPSPFAIQDRLNYLERNHLSFFADAPPTNGILP